MLERMASAKRPGFWALTIVLLAIAGLAGRAACAEWADFPPTTFKIYSEDGRQVIGSSHYFVERLGQDRLRLHGENHYRNGQFDIELDTLELVPGEPIPLLKQFSHIFYKPDGSVMISGIADLKTGASVCVSDQNGKLERYTDQIEFPPDTYAGASILIPIVHALRSGVSSPIRMHFFDCTPKPKLITLEATPNRSSPSWQYYSGQLVEVQAKPDLGWLDVLAAPFLPTMHAWFNPSEGFNYVGGGINRYFYSKAHVMLVKLKPGEEVVPAGSPPPTDTQAANAADTSRKTDGAAAPATPQANATAAAPRQ